MAGFALPKLRWLVVGAVGAGIWAMTQEPPSPRKTQAPSRPAVTAQHKAEAPATPKPQAAVAPSAPKQIAATPPSAPSAPKEVVTPASRPSQIVTSSVTKPDHPVPEPAPSNALYTTTRVNLRGTANASAPVVATLNMGESVKPILLDGKWQLVSVRGRKGWILADYLHPANPNAPRPSGLVQGSAGANAAHRPEPPASINTQAYAPPRAEPRGLLSKATALFGVGRKPLRAPQAGDCQCPYDLMINGSQCGERSAYSRRSRRAVQCYL
jgi:Bacterial SH3 domain